MLLYPDSSSSHEEWGALVRDSSLGHWVEVGLVGRATTLATITKGTRRPCSLDINLSRKVATGVPHHTC